MLKSVYRFRGYIYEVTGQCGKKYIGSTLNYKNRKYAHLSKREFSNSRHLEKPLTFRLIREDSYKLLKTMYLVEQFYIDNIDGVINKKRSYVSESKKKQLCRERSLKWYYANKNKPYVIQVRKARNELYREMEGGDYMRKAARKWYNKNKDTKVICKCGSKVQLIKLRVHCASIKHQRWENDNKLQLLIND